MTVSRDIRGPGRKGPAWIPKTAWFPKTGAAWTEVFVAGLVYAVTAQLSHALALPPGTVAPVWLPSGLMLAWGLIRGAWIWPGVFLGALLGNTWVYADLSSAQAMVNTGVAGLMNATGDALCLLAGVVAVGRAPAERPFSTPGYVLAFVLGG
ncbi:MAG: MASE1 domain-containing protein, partial [Rhodobacterales bacterium]|nr:MASE1 domain-containing protein [Rhodobacterales bacterium]